jgi:repressor LexA
MTISAAEKPPPLGPLSTRQREVLEFIRDYIATQGYPPSVRDIASGVGLSSVSSAHAHLATLGERGYLRRDESRPRALVLLDGRL